MNKIYLHNGFHTAFQLNTWKLAKWGVLSFCIVHWIFEIGTGNEKYMFIPVIANYYFSAWFIKERIRRDRFSEQPFLVGLSVACVVFLIRVVLGLIYSSLVI